MFRSLPTLCRRLCKFTLTFVLLWLFLVFLWLVTPSPTPSYTAHPNAILEQANKDKALTVVYPTDKFFRSNDGRESVKKAYRQARHYFGMQFRVWVDSEVELGGGREKEVIKMMFGGGEDPLVPWNYYNRWQTIVPLSNTTITLYKSTETTNTSAATDEDPNHLAHSSFPIANGEISLSPPIPFILPNGDDDGMNLPWFNKADSALFFWWILHDNIEMPVRVRRVRMRERTGRMVDGKEVLEEKEKVEIWADAAEWDFVSTNASGLVHLPFRRFLSI
jgi:hypothetical protein